MRFTQGALLATVAAVSATVFLSCPVDAFSTSLSSSPSFLSARTTFSNTNLLGQSSAAVARQSKVTFLRLAVDDDDDDDDDDFDDDNDDDDEEPLAEGVDSVSWLPSVVGGKTVAEAGGSDGENAQVLPLFPLGGIVYTPNSEHVLNIFEPRYREMYSDILMNGTKRFVVSMSHPTEAGRFAQVGVVFELLDLKEVSEQTQDQIKYICSHKVTGRVKLHRVLNPEAWENRDTYLRVEGTLLADDDDDEEEADVKDNSGADIYGSLAAAVPGNPTEEKKLRNAFADLVEVQHEMEEDVRFTRASIVTLAVKPGAEENGLWQTVRLWQSFVDQRLMARQNELQRDFQEKLQEFLKQEKGLKEEELPSTIGFGDLTPALQKEVQELQKRMAVELEPLVLESTLTMQKILEAADHTERLKLVRYFIASETKRLNTKRTIQGMFAKSKDDDDDKKKKKQEPAVAAIPPEEQVVDSDKAKEDLMRSAESTPDSKPSALFMDEPDAFQ